MLFKPLIFSFLLYRAFAVTRPKGSAAFMLPMNDPYPSQRAQQIKDHRNGFLYGPSIIGNTSYFPNGVLEDGMVAAQVALAGVEADANEKVILDEVSPVYDAAMEASGLHSMDSFEILYKDQWAKANPTGIMSGSYTNFTHDLFFSMERLSVSPFSLIRLDPRTTKLPFAVDDKIATRLTTMTLSKLHIAGRLFLIDHSFQAPYPRETKRYAAACSTYFYIHPVSEEFLPLAIKTNVGKNLTYTPADSHEDWLLAKIMFNNNDLFSAQVGHLASTHAVAEIVNLAALRTMANEHPIRGFLERVMYRAYAVRALGQVTLFNKGGLLDQNFALNSDAVHQFEDEFYPTSAGLFQANYLDTWFTKRGLINCPYGPQLKHFPYHEEGSAIVAAIRRFTTAFIDTYYTTPDLLVQDHELQTWLTEANGPAKVLDFPAHPLKDKETLIDILTQIAYLTGVMHHALNSGTLSASWTLPMHPAALYKPVPTAKGVTDLLPYLPDTNASLSQIALFLSFNRPGLMNSGGDLRDMFGVSGLLARAGSESVAKASLAFGEEMEGISRMNDEKEFDEEGLCQGMPFIWKSLDPKRIPSFLTI